MQQVKSQQVIRCWECPRCSGLFTFALLGRATHHPRRCDRGRTPWTAAWAATATFPASTVLTFPKKSPCYGGQGIQRNKKYYQISWYSWQFVAIHDNSWLIINPHRPGRGRDTRFFFLDPGDFHSFCILKTRETRNWSLNESRIMAGRGVIPIAEHLCHHLLHLFPQTQLMAWPKVLTKKTAQNDTKWWFPCDNIQRISDLNPNLLWSPPRIGMNVNYR